MKLVWTKSNTALSKLIRWLTKEDCSHFAFVFPDDRVMFESNLLGTHPAFYSESLKTHTVVHEIEVECSQEEAYAVWDNVTVNYAGKGYDYTGALYLGWRKFLKTRFNVALPTVNKWAKSDRFFCDELYDALSPIKKLPKIEAGKGLDSPYDVFVKIDSALKLIA